MKNFKQFLIKIIKKLIGSLGQKEEKLLEALTYIDHFNHLQGTIDFYDNPFIFDVFRLGYTNVAFLIDRIAKHDCYLLKNIKNDAPTVIDIGSHIGVFPRYLLGEKPKATVHAFEPDRENFLFMELNLKMFQNAFLYQKGALDKKETLELYTSSKLDWRSTFAVNSKFLDKSDFEKGEYSAVYSVELIEIDSFMDALKTLDLLRISVPGEIEHLVLLGAQKTIEKYRPQISISVYPVNIEKVRKIMSDIGGYQEMPSPYQPSNIRIFTNYDR